MTNSATRAAWACTIADCVTRPAPHDPEGARAEEIQHQALSEGMETLRQDGIEKVLQGLTSLDDVRAMSNA